MNSRLDGDQKNRLVGRFSQEMLLPILVMVELQNPVAPFEIKINGDVRERALEAFAKDLKAPARYAS